MNQKDMRQQLKTALHTDDANMSQEDMDSLIETLLVESSMRKKRRPIGTFDFLKRQVRFIGWRIWFCQGILLTCILIMFVGFVNQSIGDVTRMIKHLLFGFSLLVSAVILPTIYRSLRYRMQEVEATTYFSTARILIAKLIVVGLGDLVMLFGIWFCASVKTSISISSITLYVFLPFLLASCGLFYIMGHCNIRLLLPESAGYYILLCAGYIITRRFQPIIFEKNFSVVWVVMCVFLIVTCLYQVYQIIKKAAFTEMQIV